MSPRSDRAARLSPWGRLVAACALVVGAAALVMGVWSMASAQERQTSYSVGGALRGVALDLGNADVVIEGAGRRPSVGVEHVDRFGFGHDAQPSRSVTAGVFRVRSRCPRTILHGCAIRYRVMVPDNLPVVVRTGSGSVVLRDYRGSARLMTDSGDVDVDGFCGFSLVARADGGGDVTARTDCAPQQMSLRTTTGSVHAAVPQGRYRIDASTAGGEHIIRGLASAADAPFSIQALSSSGDVLVERRP